MSTTSFVTDPFEEGVRASAEDCFRAVLGSGREAADAVDKASVDLDWGRLCEAIRERCHSRDAAELARALGPLRGRDVVERRLDENDEAIAACARGAAPPLRGYESVGDALLRARKEDTLRPEDLLRVLAGVRASTRVIGWARTSSGMRTLIEHVDRLCDVDEVGAEIARCIDANGGVLDGASPELGPLRRRVVALRQSILDRLERIVRSPRYEGILQDDYVTIRDDRYVLPIRAGEKGDFPGIVHGQSASGHTLFIEPEDLIDANNQLRLAQLDVENEIRAILARLTAIVRRRADDLETNGDVLTYLDITFAGASLCAAMECTRPVVTAVGTLSLLRARHPVLALRELAGELHVVASDIVLRDASSLVISGPNAGGKTVSLKTIGLCALMVRAGLPIPVDVGSEIPVFDEVFTDIGDEQGVDRDLSTFSAHIANLVSFLPRCGRGSLVLLDELFAGTDPEQGAALGRALLMALTERECTVVVTTHLEALKTIAFEDPRFLAASVAFDLERLQPTYALRFGVPGASYALKIAARLGLDPGIVDAAERYLESGGDREREALIDRLGREVDAAARTRAELEAAADELESERERLRATRRRITDGERDEAERALRALRDDAVALRTEVRTRARALNAVREPEDDVAVSALREELALARAAAQRALALRAPADGGHGGPGHGADGDAAAPLQIEPGKKVWVSTLRRRGTVTEIDGQRVAVTVEGIRAWVRREDLAENPSSDWPTTESRQPRAAADVGPTAEARLDLRGERVDDALERMNATLERSALSSVDELLVIHGHGTGALKSAVRRSLTAARLQWRAGERGEGGDGVTVVRVAGSTNNP